MISRDTIDKIFAAAKIEEVVGDYVTLKRRGANLIGLCPFHNEKTGSFTVSPSKGIYKCFGCGQSGHAIGFVMEIEQCGFVEAVKQLGKKYHIEVEDRQLTPDEQQRQDDKESMFIINEWTNRWFQDQLWKTPNGQAIGLAYFRERGLRDDIIQKFQLGYSPDKGNPLAAALKANGSDEKYYLNNPDTLIGCGLCGKSEDGRIYDRFRDRVIFPIHTMSGKTVAFAGRIMRTKEGVGKYVNSPDSLIYSKTRELYGLYLAKRAISQKDLCYLVEGQMDVISMHQAGIENVVASGGTALTKPQIQLIKRLTTNITVLYDGDAAGIHAALRGIDMFLEEGFNVKVLLLPNGEDPDSFARTHNASDFLEYIQAHETDFIQFKSDLLRGQMGNDPYKQATLVKDIVQSLSLIPDLVTRQIYIKDTAERMQMNEEVLIREVSNLRRKRFREEEKKREEKERREEQIEVVHTPTQSPISPAASPQEDNKLDQNYKNLLQVVIKYGERPLYPTQWDEQGQPVEYISVGNYIISQLTNDQIEAPRPIYLEIINEFLQHEKDADFRAENFFKFHPNNEISRLSIGLIADRYQLSKMYSKQSISENVTKTVNANAEEDKLESIIQQLLLEIKLTAVQIRISAVNESIKQAERRGDTEQLRALLATQPALINFKNEICKQLGNRVIV